MDHNYVDLTPELEEIVKNIEDGDGVAIKFFRNCSIDKAIGYVKDKHADSLLLTREKGRGCVHTEDAKFYKYIDMENIEIVDSIRKREYKKSEASDKRSRDFSGPMALNSI